MLYVLLHCVRASYPASLKFRRPSMNNENAASRQDVTANSVDHQIYSLANSVASTRQLETLLTSELDDDLVAWTRQYLETYLDSDTTGRVPLDAEQLQDILE